MFGEISLHTEIFFCVFVGVFSQKKHVFFSCLNSRVQIRAEIKGENWIHIELPIQRAQAESG